MSSKKKIIIIICILLVVLFIFYLGTKMNFFPVSENRAMEIGENKYLEFLWMVDGAFNDKRYEGTYVVNNRKMSDGHKLILCDYNNKKICNINNFENSFYSLFSKKISIDLVYGDGKSFSWYNKKEKDYTFKNMNDCNTMRMGLNQTLKVSEIKTDSITYQVSFETEGVGKTFHKKFVLVYEDNNWKISKAFYHDLCGMYYYIE